MLKEILSEARDYVTELEKEQKNDMLERAQLKMIHWNLNTAIALANAFHKSKQH